MQEAPVECHLGLLVQLVQLARLRRRQLQVLVLAPRRGQARRAHAPGVQLHDLVELLLAQLDQLLPVVAGGGLLGVERVRDAAQHEHVQLEAQLPVLLVLLLVGAGEAQQLLFGQLQLAHRRLKLLARRGATEAGRGAGRGRALASGGRRRARVAGGQRRGPRRGARRCLAGGRLWGPRLAVPVLDVLEVVAVRRRARRRRRRAGRRRLDASLRLIRLLLLLLLLPGRPPQSASGQCGGAGGAHLHPTCCRRTIRVHGAT